MHYNTWLVLVVPYRILSHVHSLEGTCGIDGTGVEYRKPRPPWTNCATMGSLQHVRHSSSLKCKFWMSLTGTNQAQLLVIHLSLFFYAHSRTFFALLLEREKGGETEREREREKHQWERETSTGCLFIPALTGDRTHNLGMCPNQE